MNIEDIDVVAVARARELYLGGAATIAEVATDIGVDVRTFAKLRAREGWPLRRPPKPAKRKSKTRPNTSRRPKPRPSEAVILPPGPPPDPSQLEQRLADAVSRELSTFEGGGEQAPRTDHNARILSSLAKTLAELRKLEATPKPKGSRGQEPHGPVDPPPRDMASLREDIARKLAEFRRSRGTG